MTPERYQRILELFEEASKRAPEDRAPFLADSSAGDEDLRRQVEAMLAADSRSGGFLEKTPDDLAAGVLAAQEHHILDRPAWEAARRLLGQHGNPRLTPGAQIGPYKIEALLGAGGMGEVYRAADTRLKRTVAIKVAKENFGERFEREARNIAALNHPNICTLHDVGPNYLVMELIEGESLRAWLRRGLTVERSLGVARQVVEALCAVHRTGVIHRDLKPENVMVRVDGYVKVLDFGLAKWVPPVLQQPLESTATIGLSEPGQILGTAAYMSPEQIRGEEVDERSDLFAFGILLYEMLTGRHPWPRPSSVEILHAILHDDPPPMDMSLVEVGPPASVLEHIVRKCVAKQAGQRFQTMDDVRAALEGA